MASDPLAAAWPGRRPTRPRLHATLLGDVTVRRVAWLEDDLLGLLAGRPLVRLHLSGVSHIDALGARALAELVERIAIRSWSVSIQGSAPALRALDTHDLFERAPRLFVPDGSDEPPARATEGVLSLLRAAADGRARRGAHASRSDALWPCLELAAVAASGCEPIIDGLQRQLLGLQITHAVETEGMVLTHAAPPGDRRSRAARHVFWTTEHAHIAVVARRLSPSTAGQRVRRPTR